MKLLPLALAMLLLLRPSSEGALVTDTATFGPLAVGTPSFTVALDKFDPSRGTLTSVKLTLEGVTCGNSLIFDNEACDAGNVYLEIGTSISASTGLSLVPVLAVNPAYQGSGWVKQDKKGDGAGDFAGSDSFRISGGGSASTFAELTTPSALAQFVAQSSGETFLVTIANSLFNHVSTCGLFGPTSASGGTISGTVKVAYSYYNLAPIPEAGTGLWGAGLAIAISLRRSRARRG